MEIFYPVLLLVFHTIAVGAYMGYRRYTAVIRREVSLEFYELYIGEEPGELRVISRHMINLLETPPLLYLGAIIAFVTGQAGSVLITLAWVYVALRLVHTAVHLGSNVVVWRFRVFVLSIMVLAAFYLVLAWRILAA